MFKGFWTEQNIWWRGMAAKMVYSASEWEWKEANRRLWCLSFAACRSFDVDADARQDLVQDMLLRLQEEKVVNRLREVATPAHYIAKMMRHHVMQEMRRERITRRGFRRYEKPIETPKEEYPDQQAIKNEEAAKARFVVNHVVDAADRQLLVWFYYDNEPASEIARRLKISECAVFQRLTRARLRVKAELEE